VKTLSARNTLTKSIANPPNRDLGQAPTRIDHTRSRSGQPSWAWRRDGRECCPIGRSKATRILSSEIEPGPPRVGDSPTTWATIPERDHPIAHPPGREPPLRIDSPTGVPPRSWSRR
jgi:hypothetical protein